MVLKSKNNFLEKRPSVFFWRFSPILVLIFGFLLFFLFELDQYLSFRGLKNLQSLLFEWRDANYFISAFSFVCVYSLVSGLSIPFGFWMTIAGGLMFGTFVGGGLSLLGASIGATLLFLSVRFAFTVVPREELGVAFRKMESGFKENQLSYMLILRLVPLFPFWLVNIVPAFLDVSIRAYVLGTFIGMIPGALLFAGVGNGLSVVFKSKNEFDVGAVFTLEFLLPICGLATLLLVQVMYKKFKKSNGEY